jgi:hypothetical protein
VIIALTFANAGMLVLSLAQPHSAAAQEIAPVLRGRALEIIDDQGRIRAEPKVFPAQPALKMPDGTTGYPEPSVEPSGRFGFPPRLGKSNRLAFP